MLDNTVNPSAVPTCPQSDPKTSKTIVTTRAGNGPVRRLTSAKNTVQVPSRVMTCRRRNGRNEEPKTPRKTLYDRIVGTRRLPFCG